MTPALDVKPLVSFRVYPGKKRNKRPSGLYCRVNIWATRKQMIKHCQENFDLRRIRHTQGVFSSIKVLRFRSGRPARTLGIFGEINLYKRNLGTEPITHEVLHATLAWAKRKKISCTGLAKEEGVISDAEEYFCYAHGRMARQLVHVLYKRKFY